MDVLDEDPLRDHWTGHVGSMHGDVTAAAAADMLLQKRMDRFCDSRRDGDGPTAEDRTAFGKELGRINRYRENCYYADICDFVERRLQAPRRHSRARAEAGSSVFVGTAWTVGGMVGGTPGTVDS
eukprot:SAG31_NODE_12780_length_917_cov_2.111247_1_plen_124_part_01